MLNTKHLGRANFYVLFVCTFKPSKNLRISRGLNVYVCMLQILGNHFSLLRCFQDVSPLKCIKSCFTSQYCLLSNMSSCPSKAVNSATSACTSNSASSSYTATMAGRPAFPYKVQYNVGTSRAAGVEL